MGRIFVLGHKNVWSCALQCNWA